MLMDISVRERLTFVVSFSVRDVVDLLRQHERGEDHVADGEVTEEYVRHRAHILDLHYDEHDAHVSEKTGHEKRRDERREGPLADSQPHLPKRL